jgi:hypothetical protein
VPVAVPADVLERMALGSALAPEPLDLGERFGELVLSLFERLSLLLAMGVALRRGALSDGKLRGEALHGRADAKGPRRFRDTFVLA